MFGWYAENNRQSDRHRIYNIFVNVYTYIHETNKIILGKYISAKSINYFDQ